MSMVQRKSEELLRSSLQPGEKVLQTVRGMDGHREVFMALTTQRVCLYTMGMTKLSQPQVRHILLKDVLAADCRRAPFGSYNSGRPVLLIESRSGTFEFVVSGGDGKKVAGDLPNMILAAQSTATEVAAPPPPAASDISAQLAQLAALHDSGALSAEEFASAKARLLHD